MRKRISAWWKRFGLAVGLLGLWGLGVSVTSAPGLQAAQKYPRPTGQELQRAEKMVQEVYGRDIAKARTPSEKGKLAQEILRAAREEQDSEVRFAALEAAKRLAIAAQDGRLAVEIVREIVNGFQPAEEITPQERLAEADRLWQQAERLSGPEKLTRQLEAIIGYLEITEHCWSRIEKADPPSVVLRAQNAKLIGARITYAAQLDCILQWVNPHESILWEVPSVLPGKYEVVCEYAADSKSSFSSLFSLEINERSVLTFRLCDTGRWPTFKAVQCGIVYIPPKLNTIHLKVLQKVPPDPNMGIIALRSLQLIPRP